MAITSRSVAMMDVVRIFSHPLDGQQHMTAESMRCVSKNCKRTGGFVKFTGMKCKCHQGGAKNPHEIVRLPGYRSFNVAVNDTSDTARWNFDFPSGERFYDAS